MTAGFDAFWAAYPRKTAKGDARKAWQKLNPSDALVAAILSALDWQKNQPQWLKDDGQFIPYPATWLRGERWEDEPFNPPQEWITSGRETSAAYSIRAAHAALEAMDHADQREPNAPGAGADPTLGGNPRENGTKRLRGLH